MSQRSCINGFTAWVNLRLKKDDVMLSNVLIELLMGTHMKELVESLTGREFKRLQSFDNLTAQQRSTRAEWIIEELKKWNVIPNDSSLNYRLFGAKSSDQLFDLLWLLVCHDIWFVWERSDFLLLNDIEKLCTHEFSWIPKFQAVNETQKRYKATSNLLAGFGSAAKKYEEVPLDSSNDTAIEPTSDVFPGSYFMKSFNHRTTRNYPKPIDCVLEMIRTHLRLTPEGRLLTITDLNEMADVRPLCALINSFVTNAFTVEVLLNDRWSINLILDTMEKIFRTSTSMDSEDLAGGESRALASYFCFVFMAGYRLRQCNAVVQRVHYLAALIRECKIDLDQLPREESDGAKQRDNLMAIINKNEASIAELKARFDLNMCTEWVASVKAIVAHVQEQIKKKIEQRFEVVQIPRHIAINDLCLSLIINLSLTSDVAFYQMKGKEIVTEKRKIILRNKMNGEFLDDCNRKRKVISVRQTLGVSQCDSVELCSDNFPNYDIFLESLSKNKKLAANSYLLYQVFPGSISVWQKLLLKASKEANLNIIKNLLAIFKPLKTFINSKDPESGDTALHIASKAGHFAVVQYLLESFANIDATNNWKATPFFHAIEANRRDICHLLIEWGCNVHHRNRSRLTAFESCRNNDLKLEMMQQYEFYAERIPLIIDGNVNMLAQTVNDHRSGLRPLCNLRSRCINGSTLLHTAAHFGDRSTVLRLIQTQIDVNLCDYKGATPLHRASNVPIVEALLDAGAEINSKDNDGNEPLHVKCYGEMQQASRIDIISKLLEKGADITARNEQLLMPVHCAAMQGRRDVIELIFQRDTRNSIEQMLRNESETSPPSLLHLALANDMMQCADWLLTLNYGMKPRESDLMLGKIVTAKLNLTKRTEVTRFLLERCQADTKCRYEDGNTALHFAAALPDASDLVVLLLDFGADSNARNYYQCTPLFGACQTNHYLSASLLLEWGADIRSKNNQGLTALDYISNYDEWMECGYFSEDVRARLRIYNLKHSRNLVRSISRKIQPLMKPPSALDIITNRFNFALNGPEASTITCITIGRSTRLSHTAGQRHRQKQMSASAQHLRTFCHSAPLEGRAQTCHFYHNQHQR